MRSDEFGVIICCCKFDYFLAKGCVASVRHVMPDVPVTLLIDGELDASRLAKAYELNVMKREQVKDPWLREVFSGWGSPKMTMLWESPYERFLYLDCDTILWGDVVKAHGGKMDWDMAVDEGDAKSRAWVPRVGSDAWVNQEYFNIEKMEKIIPDFPWRKYAPSLFCTGTFFARRGAFSLAEYQEVFRLRAKNPGFLPIGEMGMMNVMIFRAVEAGRLKLTQVPMELVCDYSIYRDLGERFRIDGNGPRVRAGDEKVLHFTDPKPLTRSYGFHEPMTYFRMEAARRMKKMGRHMGRAYLWVEETPWHATTRYRRKYARHHRLVKPLLEVWRAVRGR